MASKTAEAARKMAKSEKYLYGKSKITKDRGMLREIWKIRTPGMEMVLGNSQKMASALIYGGWN